MIGATILAVGDNVCIDADDMLEAFNTGMDDALEQDVAEVSDAHPELPEHAISAVLELELEPANDVDYSLEANAAGMETDLMHAMQVGLRTLNIDPMMNSVEASVARNEACNHPKTSDHTDTMQTPDGPITHTITLCDRCGFPVE